MALLDSVGLPRQILCVANLGGLGEMSKLSQSRRCENIEEGKERVMRHSALRISSTAKIE